ncbi:SHOCT domain-containing protein [Rhodanobacter sp. 115]|uniref:SHOCT domain-containing protein n=1 Tax=Rhodanobacter sp. FW021-MT20 TaxID=1162282 RepID=UPI000565A833|nr:SHOCT domain-containing protein [Rhodanobacter sp. 115]
MGFDSIWHLLILVIVLAVPVAIIVLIVRLVRGLSRRAGPGPSTEARLRELASLKARGLVTEAEYERQRRAIIGDV